MSIGLYAHHSRIVYKECCTLGWLTNLSSNHGSFSRMYVHLCLLEPRSWRQGVLDLSRVMFDNHMQFFLTWNPHMSSLHVFFSFFYFLFNFFVWLCFIHKFYAKVTSFHQICFIKKITKLSVTLWDTCIVYARITINTIPPYFCHSCVEHTPL